MSSATRTSQPLADEQLGVAADIFDVGERHHAEKALGLGITQSRGTFNPVGERNHAAGTNEPRRLRNQPRLVGDVAPRVLAPDKIRAGRGQAAVACVGEHEADAIIQAFFTRQTAPALDHGLGRIDADHRGDVARSHQEAHPRAVAAAQVDPARAGGDFRARGEVERRLHATDVKLLAKHQLHEVALHAAVHGDDVSQADTGERLHGLRARTNALMNLPSAIRTTLSMLLLSPNNPCASAAV